MILREKIENITKSIYNDEYLNSYFNNDNMDIFSKHNNYYKIKLGIDNINELKILNFNDANNYNSIKLIIYINNSIKVVDINIEKYYNDINTKLLYFNSNKIIDKNINSKITYNCNLNLENSSKLKVFYNKNNIFSLINNNNILFYNLLSDKNNNNVNNMFSLSGKKNKLLDYTFKKDNNCNIIAIDSNNLYFYDINKLTYNALNENYIKNTTHSEQLHYVKYSNTDYNKFVLVGNKKIFFYDDRDLRNNIFTIYQNNHINNISFNKFDNNLFLNIDSKGIINIYDLRNYNNKFSIIDNYNYKVSKFSYKNKYDILSYDSNNKLRVYSIKPGEHFEPEVTEIFSNYKSINNIKNIEQVPINPNIIISNFEEYFEINILSNTYN